MKKSLFYFAATGWALSLTIHLSAIADDNAASKMPFAWLLHLGVCIVWIPTVIISAKNEKLKTIRQLSIGKQLNPAVAFKIFFQQTPRWLAIIVVAGVFYAIVNFIFFMATSPIGVADIKDGQFVLHNHGKLIKTLTAQEYNQYHTNELRAFSGHWLLFYGVAAAILFPFNKQKNQEHLP